jgi:hypothetical protein
VGSVATLTSMDVDCLLIKPANVRVLPRRMRSAAS